MATIAEIPIPPADLGLETTWAYLEEGVDHIMTRLGDGISYAKFMNLQTIAYNYCVSPRMHRNLESSAGLDGHTGANLMGAHLYNKLVRYFIGHLTTLRETSEPMVNEVILQYYALAWDRYTTGANYVNRVFLYLNRNWVKRERDEGRENVYQIYTLSLVQWKLDFFLHVQKCNKLTSAILKLIESQRNGETIDQGLVNVVKKVINSFVSLGLDESDTNKVSLEVYKEHFEGPFIAVTEKHYNTKYVSLLGTTLPDYLKRADELLRIEDQIQVYLNANTSKIITQKCERFLIPEYLEKMRDGFPQLLLEYDKVKDDEEKAKNGDGKDKDLQRTYALLVRIPEGREFLRKKFEEHVKRAGQQAISKLVGEGGADVDSLEPKAYVEALLEVRGKNELTVHQCFGGEKGFVTALDNAWRYFINRNHTKLASAVLKLIELQRNGETIDQGLMKKVIDSFVSLGLDESDTNKVSLEVYKEHFEGPFITATEKHYDTKYISLLETTLPDYLRRADELLRIEDQIQVYLNANTSKIITQKCEHLFIQEYLEKMWNGFQQLLDCDKYEDLQRMYTLLARSPEGLESLRKKFEEHVKRAGQQAISKLVGEGGADIDSLEPKVYVDALLEVYRKNQHNVQQGFKNETGFVGAFDKACRDFVNRNAATGSSTTKSPELLAKHTDALLRKNNKLAEGSELEVALNQVMVLFKYIDDKDVFQTFYTTKLSKRLIHNVSASDEAEASMISKLKDACGFEYTNKLQRMFTDMSLSKDLTDQFKERIEQSGDTNGDITFGIMVFGTNRWPLKALAHEFVIPREILPIYERFTRYYQNKHPGRKLTWLWNHSKNELHTNYLNQKYILMTSSHQMAVLIQYNTNDTLSLDELISATGITKDLLVQILGVLVKAKVLINEETDQYDLNPKFKLKKIRVNLDLPIKAEVKAEAVDVLKAVEEDRKYVIQATIVRIMKTRKTLKNQALIEQVVSQISQRFTPKIGDIKKAIETLLEKEYIERAEDQCDTYHYLA